MRRDASVAVVIDQPEVSRGRAHIRDEIAHEGKRERRIAERHPHRDLELIELAGCGAGRSRRRMSIPRQSSTLPVCSTPGSRPGNPAPASTVTAPGGPVRRARATAPSRRRRSRRKPGAALRHRGRARIRALAGQHDRAGAVDRHTPVRRFRPGRRCRRKSKVSDRLTAECGIEVQTLLPG